MRLLPTHASAPAGAEPNAGKKRRPYAVGWQPGPAMEEPWAENTRPEACLATSRLAIISVAISAQSQILDATDQATKPLNGASKSMINRDFFQSIQADRLELSFPDRDDRAEAIVCDL